MNVILCGYNWTGCKALQILRGMGHNVFVFTHESPYHIPSLVEYCRASKTSYSLTDISKAGLPFIPDVVCSVFYRYIIKKNIIASCKGKIFNLHPSFLPMYRGCSSLTWAIINGEKETGFTYHYIDEGTDTGDIILQESLPIEDFDTQETLYLKVMVKSMEKFPEALEAVSSGLPGKKQEGPSSYYPRGCPFDGQIDPSWDEDYKKRFIRAMIYPPHPVAKIGDKEIYGLD